MSIEVTMTITQLITWETTSSRFNQSALLFQEWGTDFKSESLTADLGNNTSNRNDTEHQLELTAPTKVLPFTMSTICSAMSSPQRAWASLVLAPR